MFVAKSARLVPGHKLMPCTHLETHFRIGSRVATKWRETNPNMSFGPKVVDCACLLRKVLEWFRGDKVMPCMHPKTRFRNASCEATKWQQTTITMSFGPKLVDWA